MVGDDYVRAELVDIPRFLGAGNPAVHRDKELGIAFVENFIHHIKGQAVAVRAFGDIHARLDSEIEQRLI